MSDATYAELRAQLPPDGDELTVLDHLTDEGMAEHDLLDVAKRLLVGLALYGPLSLLADGRDWRKEAREEWLDMMVYEACAELTGREE